MNADLRHALRVLFRAPGFSLAVIMILALGIGVNSAIFSVVDRALIRPLPYADPSHLAMLWEDYSAFGRGKSRMAPANFLDIKRMSRTLEDVAAYTGPAEMDLAGSGPPEEVSGITGTANLLSVLGVAPMLGRTFLPEEERPDSNFVVLSYRLWQRRYNGDPNLVGRAIQMSNRPMIVVGIMPPGFQFPDRQTEFWIPIGMSPQLLARRNSHFLKVVARTKTDLRVMQSEMDQIAKQLAATYPRTNDRIGILAIALKDEVLGETRTTLLVLMCAAGCVLLIACANVANLLLARASARGREIAVRIALGASRARLLRQILTESVVLASAGGALGMLFAIWSMSGLKLLIPTGLSGELGLNVTVVVFTSIVSLATALLFGMGPALQTSRFKLGSRTVTTRDGRLRDMLFVAEVAVALVLVVGAGLLIKTLARIHAMDPGFRTAGILTAEINVPFNKDHGRNHRFYHDVLDRARTIPGVKSVGLTSDLPYTSRGNTMAFTIEGRPQAQMQGLQDALFRLVSPGYLETIGARLKEGRYLEPRDAENAPPVVVVNETLANTYFPGESAVGHRIDSGTGDGKPRMMTIVGVVREIRERGVDPDLKSGVYVPFEQTPITFFQPSEIAVLTTRGPLSMSKELQQAVWSIDPDQPVSNIRTMDAIVDRELANRTEVLWLLGAFAALALGLASLGIYGVLSYLVSQRTREIGLRMAIGATRWDVTCVFLGYSMRLTAIGLAAGTSVAMMTTRLLSTLLYGVSPLDVRTFGAVACLLLLVAVAASAIPTRRAATVDPVIALREE
jgi:putative ABC transport system permease protein